MTQIEWLNFIPLHWDISGRNPAGMTCPSWRHRPQTQPPLSSPESWDPGGLSPVSLHRVQRRVASSPLLPWLWPWWFVVVPHWVATRWPTLLGEEEKVCKTTYQRRRQIRYDPVYSIHYVYEFCYRSHISMLISKQMLTIRL